MTVSFKSPKGGSTQSCTNSCLVHCMPKAGAVCSKGTVLATDTSMQKVTYATGQGCTNLLYNTRDVQYPNTFYDLLFLKNKKEL